MRITFAILTSIAMIGVAVPALAQGAAGCPPGLQNKGCLPPGQAKKMMPGYASSPVLAYPPAGGYVSAYPAYYGPSGGNLSLGLNLPLR